MRKNATGKIIVWILMLLLILSAFSSCENEKDINDVSSDIITSQTSDDVDSSSMEATDNTSSEADDIISDLDSEEAVSNVSSDASVVSTPTQSQVSTPAPSTSTPASTPTPTPSTPENEPEPENPKTAKELIIGRWKGTHDMAPALQSEGYSVESPCNVDLIIEFTSSGSTVQTVNMSALRQVLRPVLEEEMLTEIANNGMTVEEFEAGINMTLAEYIDAVLLLFFDDMNMVGSYKFDGDILSMKDEDETEYSVSEYAFNGENNVSITDDGETISFSRIQ